MTGNNHYRNPFKAVECPRCGFGFDEDITPPDYEFFDDRNFFVSGPEGFVMIDIDGSPRWHGPKFGTDSIGMYAKVERKCFERNKNKTFKNYKVQYWTYGASDLVSSLSPLAWRDKGSYLIWSNEEGFKESTEYQINGIDVTVNDIIDFYNAKAFNRFPREPFHDVYEEYKKSLVQPIIQKKSDLDELFWGT